MFGYLSYPGAAPPSVQWTGVANVVPNPVPPVPQSANPGAKAVVGEEKSVTSVSLASPTTGKSVSTNPDATDAKGAQVKAVVQGMIGSGRKMRGRIGTRADGKGTIAKLFNATGMPQPMKVKPNTGVFRFTHVSEALGALATSTTVPVAYSLYFALSQFSDVSTLTAIFDQYKIEMVEVWFMPRNSIVSGNTANTGVMHTVVDYDDANALGSVAAAATYANVQVGTGVQSHYRKFRPHVAVAAYSGTFTSFSNQDSQWIDAASPGVQHYGFKAISTVTDAIYTWDAVWRVHFAFRNVY